MTTFVTLTGLFSLGRSVTCFALKNQLVCVLAKRARDDGRDWQVKRRERTRQLIELGGLVAKAGLIELTEDDRAVLFGASLEVAARLRSDELDQCLTVWRRRGKRQFANADSEMGDATDG